MSSFTKRGGKLKVFHIKVSSCFSSIILKLNVYLYTVPVYVLAIVSIMMVVGDICTSPSCNFQLKYNHDG